MEAIFIYGHTLKTTKETGNKVKFLFLAPHPLRSLVLSNSRWDAESRRNNIAIFGMAVAYIINIFLLQLANQQSIPDSLKGC